MKNTAWSKNYLVVMHSDYDNTWVDKTIPCTLKQAIKFVNAKRWNNSLDKGIVRIVTLAEWANINTSLELNHV